MDTLLSASFFIVTIVILLFTLTIHEYAHAWVADRLGDPTPRYMRRLTLNPLAHIDPIGFIALLLVRFGWAKPVPINPRNFHNQGRDTALVSLAGPFSNFLMAWLLAGVIKFVPMDPNSLLAAALTYAIWINLALGVFNLIPIPPLDGSKIAEFLLPYQYAWRLKQLEPYGMFILLFILFSPLREVLFAVIESIFKLLV